MSAENVHNPLADDAGSSAGPSVQRTTNCACSNSTDNGASSSAQGDVGTKRKLKIAVAGCAHGEMDRIYEALGRLEQQEHFKADLLICCGDYQAVRNWSDLKTMACPEKYRELNSFYKYYSGERVAPVLTVFVGGNHEASNYMQELPYGGWVAPRIFYAGHANVFNFAGLRIAALSGIWNGRHYNLGRFESVPFTDDTCRSVFHTRNLDVFRLKQLRTTDRRNVVDIMITHDWPRGITDHGDKEQLFRWKPFFREDIDKGQLGSPATPALLDELKPRYWFAAHLHCKFPALVNHENGEQTRFLALDKPLPRRQFLQVMDIDVVRDSPANDDLDAFYYDEEWLAVLKSTDHLFSAKNQATYMPSAASMNERYDFKPSPDELSAVRSLLPTAESRRPPPFARTAPSHRPLADTKRNCPPPLYYRNPQTADFCARLGVFDLNAHFCTLRPDLVGDSVDESGANVKEAGAAGGACAANPDEIDIDEENVEDEGDDAELEAQVQQILHGDSKPPPDSDDLDTDDLFDFVAPPLKRKTPSDDVAEKTPDTPAVTVDNPANTSAGCSTTGSNIGAMAKFKRRNVAIYEQSDDGD